VKFPKRHKDYAALVHVNNYKFKHIAIQEIFGNDKPGSASINESSLEKYVEKGESKLIENFTRRHLLRTYPANSRQDSSNPDPMKSWCVGTQLAALNYQTGDYPMFLNQGKFRDNGHCGYVLKPPYLRDAKINDNPNTVKVTIRPMLGRMLNAPTIDDCDGSYGSSLGCSISLHGIEAYGKYHDPIIFNFKSVRDKEVRSY